MSDNKLHFLEFQQDTYESLGLLFSIVASLLILPFFEGLFAGKILTLVCITVIAIICAFVTRGTLRTFTLVLLAVTAPTTWATLFFDSSYLFAAHCAIGSVFFWYVGVLVFRKLVTKRVATLAAIIDAVCTFLLFGLAWALAYWACYSVIPNSFRFPDDNPHHNLGEVFSQFVYFSFVTMTTLGFGDIIPLGRVPQTLVWMQAVVGQFYIAVVVAWLVNTLPRSNPISETTDKENSADS